MTFFSTWAACAGPAAAHSLPLLVPVSPARTVPVVEVPPSGPATAATLPVPDLADMDDPAAHCLLLGRQATMQHDLHHALQWFDRAVVHAPDLGIAHFCRALCLLDIGMESEAKAAFERALRCDPRDGAVRIQLARIHARTGRSDLATLVVGPALVAAPDLADALAEDPAFAALRDHPHWLQMLGRL